jgi:hypothetical protein
VDISKKHPSISLLRMETIKIFEIGGVVNRSAINVANSALFIFPEIFFQIIFFQRIKSKIISWFELKSHYYHKKKKKKNALFIWKKISTSSQKKKLCCVSAIELPMNINKPK